MALELNSCNTKNAHNSVEVTTIQTAVTEFTRVQANDNSILTTIG